MPSSGTIRVLRQTERDAVVVKPAGMSSEAPGGKLPESPGRERAGEHEHERTRERASAARTLIEHVRVQLAWPDAQLPHRLDRPTRGLVVVARDRAAVAAHNEAIREGRWTKHYIARVCACPPGLVGEHRAFIRREGKLARLVRSGGDPARLEVLAVAPAPRAPAPPAPSSHTGGFHALIRLDTGRFHQIRVMLAGLGAPLVGDADYGGPRGTFYLEHAVLSYPDIATGETVRIFQADDPEREPLDPGLASALASVLTSAG